MLTFLISFVNWLLPVHIESDRRDIRLEIFNLDSVLFRFQIPKFEKNQDFNFAGQLERVLIRLAVISRLQGGV